MGYFIGIMIYLVLLAVPITAVILANKAKKKYIREKRDSELRFALEMEKMFDEMGVPKEKREIYRKAYIPSGKFKRDNDISRNG